MARRINGSLATEIAPTLSMLHTTCSTPMSSTAAPLKLMEALLVKLLGLLAGEAATKLAPKTAAKWFCNRQPVLPHSLPSGRV
jgi:hypothetical protein